MRKSVLFLTVAAAVLAVAGCKSKRELAARSDVRASLTEQSGRETRESGSRDSSGTRTVESVADGERSGASETETRITEYDTSKPLDGRTGRPPVARETVTVRRTEDREAGRSSVRRTEGSLLAERVARDVREEAASQASGAATTDVSETRKRSAGSWPWWIVAAVAAVVWWRVRELRRP